MHKQKIYNLISLVNSTFVKLQGLNILSVRCFDNGDNVLNLYKCQTTENIIKCYRVPAISFDPIENPCRF